MHAPARWSPGAAPSSARRRLRRREGTGRSSPNSCVKSLPRSLPTPSPCAREVGLAALPGGAGEHLPYGRHEPLVGVGGDYPHAREANGGGDRSIVGSRRLPCNKDRWEGSSTLASTPTGT